MTWINVEFHLPNENELVLITNGKGLTTLGCRVWISESWYWALAVSGIYQDGVTLTAECEIHDIDVKYWHELPKGVG
jgi:hypothetical protein